MQGASAAEQKGTNRRKQAAPHDGSESNKRQRRETANTDDRGKQMQGHPDAESALAMATMPPVLNQGSFGTCVAYAFAQALQTGLMGKYGVPVNAAELVATVKALCPCWNGHDTERMVEEWNKVHKKENAAIEDVDKKRRYNVRMTSRQVRDFEEAYCETESAENLKMYLLCTIKTNEDGHERHALALAGVFVSEGGEKKMQALNSWGSNET